MLLTSILVENTGLLSWRGSFLLSVQEWVPGLPNLNLETEVFGSLQWLTDFLRCVWLAVGPTTSRTYRRNNAPWSRASRTRVVRVHHAAKSLMSPPSGTPDGVLTPSTGIFVHAYAKLHAHNHGHAFLFCSPPLLWRQLPPRALVTQQQQVSALCYRILTVLSQNRHVAQAMSSEPALRAVLVAELRRQVKGWNSSPSQGSGSASGAGEQEGQSSVDGRGESAHGAASSRERQSDSRPPPASIVVDPVHLTLTLETLRNVMRASRRRNSRRNKVAVATAGGAGAGWGSQGTGDQTMPLEEEGKDVPWPFRSLYGEDNYYGGAGGGDESYDARADVAFGEGPVVAGAGDHWPLDRKLVADIAELMLSAASVRGSEAVRGCRPEF